MYTKSHKYKNAYVEDVINEVGEVVSHKQWDDGIIVIHREWDYDENGRKVVFRDILDGYCQKTSYHKLKDLLISHTWSNLIRYKIFTKNNHVIKCVVY